LLLICNSIVVEYYVNVNITSVDGVNCVHFIVV